jgi:hypothetical protein
MLELSRRGARGACAIAVAALWALAGCGGGGEKAQVMSFEIAESGGKARFTGVPTEVRGGMAELKVKNAGRDPHSAQLARIEGQQSAEEALEAIGKYSEGRPLADWLIPAGGLGAVKPGQTGSVVQPLPEGRYVVFDTEGEGDFAEATKAELEVRGGGPAGELPKTPATIRATEYKFDVSGLKAGKNRVAFENAGRQPHIVGMAPIKRGKTIEDVRRFIETERGEPPISEEQSVDSAALDGGMSQVVEFDLKPGKYAAVCFIPDRQGGPPHAMKGMISEVQVQ